MKTQLLFLFVLFTIFCLPSINKAEQTQDSLNPCWKMVHPNEPEKGFFNPDSVMYDSCLCTIKPWEYPPCPYQYAKQWFGAIIPYRALLIPQTIRDTLIYKTWRDIDSSFIELRKGIETLENQFGTFVLIKKYPDIVDSTKDGSKYFKIKFDNYVKIVTIVNYLWGSAGPLGMLTVSDMHYPYWNGNTNSFENFPGNNVILRLERRSSPSNETYKLISAGHNSSESFIVYSDGKVNVDGLLCAKEVRVSLSGAPCWPDNVFQDNYNLIPLVELEKSIKTNKHLPDIPSAEEVAQNGVELGDMQSKLLKKIEELTLYVIELKKENQEIKKQLKKVRK